SGPLSSSDSSPYRFLFILLPRPPPSSPLFPYTTLYDAGHIPIRDSGDEYTTLAKAIKELADEGMTYGVAYRVLGGAGMFDTGKRVPTQEAIDSDFARDTGKVYDGRKFYIWNREALLETLTASRG